MQKNCLVTEELPALSCSVENGVYSVVFYLRCGIHFFHSSAQVFVFLNFLRGSWWCQAFVKVGSCISGVKGCVGR